MSTNTTGRDDAGMNPTEWNGIEGLTAQQVEKLTDSELRNVMPNAELLALARSMAADNLLGALYFDVAPPADATAVYGWCDMGDDGENKVFRLWVGSSWALNGGGRVEIGGTQDHTGAITRTVTLHGAEDSDGEMTPAQAREAAQTLLAAADEIERLNNSDGQQ